MSDPRERTLEQALERLLEDERHAEERARRIVAAWERGDEADDLAGLDLEPGAEGQPEPGVAGEAPRGRVLSPFRRAAAAALVAASFAAAVWFVARRGDDAPGVPGPAGASGSLVARAVTELGVLRDGASLRAAEVRLGDAVFTDDEPGLLDLQGRGELSLRSRSLVAFGEQGAALVLGELAADAGVPLALGVGFARLELEAGGRARVGLQPDGAAVPADEHPGLWFQRLGDTAPPRVLRVTVSAGSARLVGAGWHEELTSGDVLVLSEQSPPPRALTAAEREAVKARIEELWPYSGKAPVMEAGEDALDALFGYLDASPAHWDVLSEMAQADASDPKQRIGVKTTWVNFLCMHDGEESTRLLRELWLSAPDSFNAGNIVLLAERGAFEFEREVRDMVATRDGTLDDLLLPACRLGADGDADGLALLDEIVATPVDEPWGLVRTWIAACALAHGGAPRAWDGLQASLEDEVEESLDLRSSPRAARLVLLAEFFREHRAEELPSYGLIELRWLAHFRARSAEVQSPGEIRAALAALR
ncbi:MAG: hypothetical protein AAF682_16315 [Planctomycetota bacterium]